MKVPMKKAEVNRRKEATATNQRIVVKRVRLIYARIRISVKKVNRSLK